MRLYTFRHSPNPLKVRLALAELGVQCEEIEVNLFEGGHRTEAFASVNPHRKVPVLVDGALVLPESNAILSYLGRTRGGQLWPSDPASEAEALRWLFFDAFSLGNQCGTLWWTDVVSKAVGRAGAAEAVIEEAVRDLDVALGVLDQQLDGRDWLLGTSFCLCDCAIGVAMTMLEGTRLDPAKDRPRLADYRQRIQARASWQKAGGDGIKKFG